ncbi:MAG: ATP-binding protein [Clostridia bacterium]|nr:ATP-binding protein [Clostridia bacterium]
MKMLNSSLSQDSDTVHSEKKYIFTAAEAEASGIKWTDDPPAPEKCKYCGATLVYEGYAIFGTILRWKDMPVRCNCADAISFWKKWDERKAQEAAEKAAIEAEKQRQALFESRLKYSRMSRRLYGSTFENFTETEHNKVAKTAAISYCRGFNEHQKNGVGLFIAGTCGAGKTHLASAIAIELMREGHRVIMEPSVDILATVKRGYDCRSGTTEADEIQPYLQAELLIIDDLGKEQCTPWSASTLYRIINYRYSNMLPTIVTTNYDDTKLIHRLTPSGDDKSTAQAIMSRLYESSLGISLYGRDMRQSQ